MAKMYDHAYELQTAIRESEDFQVLKDAFEKVMADESSKQMFDNFRNTQIALQEKQMQGQNITEEEVQNANAIVERVQEHPDISLLMEKEQRLNTVINDLSQIITKPLEELYGTPEEDADGNTSDS